MSDFLLAFGGTASIRRGSLPRLVGCFLGALITGPSGDRLPRKYSIVLFSVVFIVSVILQTASYNLFILLLFRLVAGISVGALSMLVPVYQSEIATKQIRGRLASLQQWAITIGIAISFWINYSTDIYFLRSSAAWRIPLALQIVPALILAIGILFFPFSPRWLMAQIRDNEALIVLRKIRASSILDVLDEYNDIKNEIQFEREQSIQLYRF